VAAWRRGAAVTTDRFDTNERLDIVERVASTILCMAPTDIQRGSPSARTLADRADSCTAHVARRRGAVNPSCCRSWHDSTGLWIRD